MFRTSLRCLALAVVLTACKDPCERAEVFHKFGLGGDTLTVPTMWEPVMPTKADDGSLGVMVGWVASGFSVSEHSAVLYAAPEEDSLATFADWYDDRPMTCRAGPMGQYRYEKLDIWLGLPDSYSVGHTYFFAEIHLGDRGAPLGAALALDLLPYVSDP